MIRLVVFDLDGTLCNTIGGIAAALNRSLSAMQLPTHSIDAVAKMVGNGMTMLCKRALPQDRQELLYPLQERYYADYTLNILEDTYPYEGITELLTALEQRGLPLAVITNKPDNNAQDVITGLLPGRFIHVQGQRKAVPKKPDPTALLGLMEREHVLPGETLYVGDADVDYLFAKNANCHFCGVSWGFRGRKFLEETTEGTIIDNPMELLALIDRL